MEIPLIKELFLIFAVSVVVLLACLRVRIPAVVGFLFTGVVVGPHGLGLVSGVHEVEILAEIGVILLLFTIGIEFSLQEFIRVRRLVLLGGGIQVVSTIALSCLLSLHGSLGFRQALFIGFLISLSSTAIVLKLLQEKAAMESPHGQVSLAVLIFQDIVVIPMMFLIPLLGGAAARPEGGLLVPLLKTLGVIGLLIAAARWVVPVILYQIARTRSRELFLLSVMVICFAVAFLTQSVGLSLALGAFVAGLIISETEFGHETLGSVIPFRDVFMGLFFVSIGMLLDVKFLAQHPLTVGLLTLSIMLGKALLVTISVIYLGYPLRTAVLAGLALCQVGEFSFVLFMRGTEFGLLTGSFPQLFLSVSVLSMSVTPFAIALAPRAADRLLKLRIPQRLVRGLAAGKAGGPERAKLKDHLIVVGFGLNGRNVAQVAKVAGIPYLIVEMNPETVRRERANGEPIHYGDATQEALLESVGVHGARVLVVVIADPWAVRKIVAVARKLNPKLFILARTRFVSEMKPLYETGANDVIPEEFETSIEIFCRVLAKYLTPREEIERLVGEARCGCYQMFRSLAPDSPSLSDLKVRLPEMEIVTLRVGATSPLAGQTLEDVRLRSKYGVTALAIQRRKEIHTNPDGGFRISSLDLLVLLGSPARLAEVAQLVEGKRED